MKDGAVETIRFQGGNHEGEATACEFRREVSGSVGAGCARSGRSDR